MTKRITITVQGNGKIAAESSGHQGPACLKDLELITALCDMATVETSNLTPEYFEAARISNEHFVQQWNDERSVQ